ncbi:uncharacterized protein PADG_11190 [Paracoccidioides brasiliensis Pb18]|uniref:Uncharacterized protein n=2 Tax=Paracoccidioides brasiliensis TaxID=121759 RepID=A0A0A0HW15_PARBD|nr:uncharacterized protein PADG_11190 [Paracoccidioides brasiliensis Pb18]KGM92732.1 hypothetical protein PADG_11190 [Paracoccidioides brasiliensis Pb18]ODH37343.1 hypothetical protein ACO22_02618 [Paracoccidioides brasiliensis]ODH46858.1 hypothetical protein GX48_07062 [Paracoccidioides brasiliensis]
MSRGEEDGRKHRCFAYNWIDGAESLERYKPGGLSSYHDWGYTTRAIPHRGQAGVLETIQLFG